MPSSDPTNSSFQSFILLLLLKKNQFENIRVSCINSCHRASSVGGRVGN